MLSYDKALELKDAGFPTRDDGRKALYSDDYGLIGGKDRCVYAPTLSELIEECRNINHDFDIEIVILRNGRCYATVRLFGFVKKIIDAETPEEAVANLYLSLKKV